MVPCFGSYPNAQSSILCNLRLVLYKEWKNYLINIQLLSNDSNFNPTLWDNLTDYFTFANVYNIIKEEIIEIQSKFL